jgi:hypothetical protein
MKKTHFKTKFLLIVGIFSIFISCKSDKKDATAETPLADVTPSISIKKSWNMAITSASDLPPNGEGSLVQRRMSKGWYGGKGKVGFGWHFFEDGTLVELSGQDYQIGKWTSTDDNKTIEIQLNEDTKKDNITVDYLSSDSTNIKVGMGKQGNRVGLKSDGATYTSPTDNPYHPINNTWRIKPTAAESEAQIKDRVKNHLQHMVKILEAGTKHQMKVMSFRSSPSMLHQYNGGVGLETANKISEGWTNCFFDKKDAKKAYDMMDKCMKVNGAAKTDAKNNWAQNNLIIFKFLYDTL